MAEKEKISGALPMTFALEDAQAYDGDYVKWPEGKYRLQVTALYAPADTTEEYVELETKCIRGPGEALDMEGRTRIDRYFLTEAARGFFVALVKRLAPWMLEPAFRPPSKAGLPTYDPAFLTGGEGGRGAVFDTLIVEDKNPNTDKVYSNINKASPPELVTASSWAITKLKAAGRAAELPQKEATAKTTTKVRPAE